MKTYEDGLYKQSIIMVLNVRTRIVDEKARGKYGNI